MAPKTRSGPQAVPGYVTHTGKIVRPYQRAPKQSHQIMPLPGLAGNHTPQPRPAKKK